MWGLSGTTPTQFAGLTVDKIRSEPPEGCQTFSHLGTRITAAVIQRCGRLQRLDFANTEFLHETLPPFYSVVEISRNLFGITAVTKLQG